MNSIEIFRNATVVEEFKAGDVVFDVGSEGTMMYAVIEGSVDLWVGDTPVERVELGGFFGEMSLIDQAPRSAKAVATTACRLAVINLEQFEDLVASTPFFAITVMERMAHRLRRANHHPPADL